MPVFPEANYTIEELQKKAMHILPNLEKLNVTSDDWGKNTSLLQYTSITQSHQSEAPHHGARRGYEN